MNKILAKIDNINAGYNGNVVLKKVSLEIRENDFIGVIGPNGGGKTTLLKVLLGILKPYSGKIIFPDGKIKIGYLPQSSQIDKSFPITVKELVESGFQSDSRLLFSLKSSQKKMADELLHETGMIQYAKKPIAELSGGQLQKLLISRAIINEPELLILDEPSTYVDKNFEGELYDWLKELNKKMAIIMVTHDVGIIPSLVKSIACVNGNLHYHPSNKITADLLKVYDCPIDLITHGEVPHRVLNQH